MNAFFGLVHLDGRPCDREELRRMAEGLAATASGNPTQTEPDFWAGGESGLGCGATAFTPEDLLARQPLVGPGGRHVLVCDARIDNRDELVDALRIERTLAANLADAALIVCAWEAWGMDCLRRVAGPFSFAIWDVRERSLFAARSLGGGRPFCYHATPRRFAFASMPRGILALPGVPRVLDEQRLADYLLRKQGDLEATFYCDIKQLPPGHALTLKAGRLDVSRFWPPENLPDTRFRRDEEYVEAFEELFERVVAAQLRSIAPVGIMLSGGLDSTSIAAVAAQQLASRGERLAAFTEVPRSGFDAPLPPNTYGDEMPLVRTLAGRYGNIDVNAVRTEGQNFLHGMDDCFDWTEAPLPNVANRVWITEIFRQARAKGIRVLLNGGQGNVTISWSGARLLTSLLRRGAWWRAVREARASASNRDKGSTSRILVGEGILPLLPESAARYLDRLRRPGITVVPNWRSFSPINPAFAEAHGASNSLPMPSFADARAQRLALLAMSHGNVEAGRALQAMHGIDNRTPLADVRLVEFCLGIPEDQFRRMGETRWLIRRAMRTRLPPQILANRKFGLQAADWFERLSGMRAQLASELAALERNDRAARVLDLPGMRGMLERWPEDGWRNSDAYHQYNYALSHGLMIGRFLAWFDRGNR